MQPQSDGPPPSNPILDAYESFRNDTPWVTRNVMLSQVGTWFVSFFFDPTYPLANIPYFTIYRFEVYRILLSPFICTRFLTLVFIYFSFVDNGRRLEQGHGSCMFAFLLVMLGVAVNFIFLILTIALSILTSSAGVLHWQAYGIWMLLFGILEIECVKAPSGSKRSLFGFATIPTEYYPLVIFGLFSILGGFQLSYLLSIGVGYLYGKGHLDRYLPNPSTLKRFEDTNLSSNLVRQKGWIVAQESLGSTAWSADSLSNSGDNHSLSLTANQATATATVAGAASSASAGEAFPSGPGRTLGSASKRTNAAVDAREARLKALEGKKKDSRDADAAMAV